MTNLSEASTTILVQAELLTAARQLTQSLQARIGELEAQLAETVPATPEPSHAVDKSAKGNGK